MVILNELRPVLPQVGDGIRSDQLVEVYPVDVSERLKIVAAADKFHLKCLKRYAALWKRERIAKNKHIHKRRRHHKQSVKGRGVIGKKKVRKARQMRNGLSLCLLFATYVAVFKEVLRVF